MTTYNFDFNKGTLSCVALLFRCGAVATVLAVSPVLANASNDDVHHEVTNEAYRVGVNASTVTMPYDKPSFAGVDSATEFNNAVSQFYADLSSNQEPLGQRFADVLSDNLWDLYIRT